MEMNNKMFKLQTGILFIGTVFAWFTVYTDFTRFYNLYGSVTKITGCTIPNPVTTPCFYGAFAFLLGFIWSVNILKKITKNEDIAIKQRNLRYLLIAGTTFAWGNFTYEIYKYYATTTAVKVSCSGVATDNVFLTACFYGSVIFLAALVTSIVIKKKHFSKVL
ncbi:hypothetical protein ACFL0C_01365 [Patescibacteria group bacterium]